MNAILLFDRVRLPDGREGTVVSGETYGNHVTVALQNGGSIFILADLLRQIDFFSPPIDLKIEMDESLKTINRVAVEL